MSAQFKDWRGNVPVINLEGGEYHEEHVNVVMTSRRTKESKSFTDAMIDVRVDSSAGIFWFVIRDGAGKRASGTYAISDWTVEASPSSSGGGGCILTTACVRAQGLPDDCAELGAFRRLRDGYVLHQPSGEDQIRRYYRTAPALIEAIDARPDADAVWARIYVDAVAKLTALIEYGELDAAAVMAWSVFDELVGDYSVRAD